MKRRIVRAAVIGAGVMGSSIAALIANAGIPCYLYDVVPNNLTSEEERKGYDLSHPEVRTRFASRGKLNLLSNKQNPLYILENADLITPVNLEDHLSLLGEVDWVCECIIENLEIKQNLFAKIAENLKSDAVISTNTSGLGLNEIASSLQLKFRHNFLGTHFFNPPRYMKLLEIVPCKDTDPEIVEFMAWFGDRILGKGVVIGKDTPNFIANRIGAYGIALACKLLESEEITVSEMDMITGPLMGKSKSATFRTLDIVGLDTVVHVFRHMYTVATDPEEKEIFRTPDFLLKMVEKNCLGMKTGGGFYRKQKENNTAQSVVMNTKTLEYEPSREISHPSLIEAGKAAGSAEKMEKLVFGADKASLVAWNIQKKILLYAANLLGEIADDIIAIDHAMKWGFGWELGPFETWDAMGIQKVAARLGEEGEAIPDAVKALLETGGEAFYKHEEGTLCYFDPRSGGYKKKLPSADIININYIKKEKNAVLSNESASLVDIGNEVLCLEFHSPNQSINNEVLDIMEQSIFEMEKNYAGMIVANQAKNFCVGADLKMIMTLSREHQWEELNKTVKRLQDALMAMKYASKPVVAAPFGMTLGGGCEICLHANTVRAAGETYMGLVEAGVGLIPGGGGHKEILIRNTENLPEGRFNEDLFLNTVFQTIAMAKVSTSGPDAQKLGLMRKTEQITTSLNYLIRDAKQTVLELNQLEFKPLQPKKIRVAGEKGFALLKLRLWSMLKGGFISEHDAKVGLKTAGVLCGGAIPAGSMVTEQYLLDIEREAFLSLCGEMKTQERMLHMLTTGKPLRN